MWNTHVNNSQQCCVTAPVAREVNIHLWRADGRSRQFPHRPKQWKKRNLPQKHQQLCHFWWLFFKRLQTSFFALLRRPFHIFLSLLSKRCRPESFMASVIFFQDNCYFVLVITLDCLAVSGFLCWLYSSIHFLISMSVKLHFIFLWSSVMLLQIRNY